MAPTVYGVPLRKRAPEPCRHAIDSPASSDIVQATRRPRMANRSNRTAGGRWIRYAPHNVSVALIARARRADSGSRVRGVGFANASTVLYLEYRPVCCGPAALLYVGRGGERGLWLPHHLCSRHDATGARGTLDRVPTGETAQSWARDAISLRSATASPPLTEYQ